MLEDVRRGFAIVIATLAATAGCSLLVDSNGLSTASESVPPDGSSSDAPAVDGASGDAATDANALGDAKTDAGACPAARGPKMVRVTDVHGTFCIDATEVTNKHMNEFLASSARPTAPTACSFKTTYGGAARPNDDKPVALVDWCDAWMYGAWAGKRLCGSRNGTPIDDQAPANDPQVSEWFAACTRDGTRTYPYGSTFDKNACNGCQRTDSCDAGGSPLVDVGSLATCTGGYDAIFDMSGNVNEWEDNCNSGEQCPPRGGNATMGAATLGCAIANTNPIIAQRNEKGDKVGIRCCAN